MLTDEWPARAAMSLEVAPDAIQRATAVFHGEADAAIPMDKAEQLLKELGNGEELVRVPGAGHASNLSHPSEVNGPLVTFLRRHRP
ncbi:MAG TPA: alpha/beta hydrolase [Acidimicrobiia bacterium]|nr:alpha/beta hydrolase [Acidimicrobiia bacterium]